MSDFVVSPPPADQEPPAPPSAAIVAGDAFWPGIDIADVRDAARIDTTIPPARLRDAVRQAMLDLSRELRSWRAAQEALGHASLTAVPAAQVIDGQSNWSLLWARAVYSTVAADLAERLIGQGLTNAGADRVEQLREEISEHRRNAQYAVRDFLGVSRVTAEAL